MSGFALAGIDLVQLLLAAGALAGALLLRWLLDRVIDATVCRSGAATTARRGALEITLRLASYAVVLAGLWIALSLADLPSAPYDWALLARRIYLTVLSIFGVLALYRISVLLVGLATQARGERAGFVDRQLQSLLRDLARIAAILLVVILVIQAWGYDAGALIAGVGIGGLAIAFAAQDAIANILGSVVIYTDRPYRIGDWVVLDGAEGSVEEIGIRSTRIRTADRKLVIVPNKKVVENQIRNSSLMTHRRVQARLALTYSTPPDLLERTVAELDALVRGAEGFDPETALVAFEQFGESGQIVLVEVLTAETAYVPFMAMQQRLLLDIRRKLDELGIELAFPSQTVYNVDAAAPKSSDAADIAQA
jgi:MscS family membrane protein